jgi:pimeloyl-ACP methyl ester carboxylesterase
MIKLFLLFSLLFCSGCMSSFVLTMHNKDIKKHYAAKNTRPTFNYLKTSVGKMFYATQGDSTKPLLVLIHGAPGRWYSSLNLFDDSTLLKQYFIISFDRLGFGKSTNTESVTYIDTQVQSIVDLVNQLNYTNAKITLVGRSYGTPIAARYAMLYPNTIKKLFLLAPCIDPKKEKFFWFSYVNKIGIINNLLPNDLFTTTEEKFTHIKELKKIEKDWNKITASTYVLQGRKDWIADTANAYFAQKAITNANSKIYLLDNTGHNVTYSHFELIKQLILE